MVKGDKIVLGVIIGISLLLFYLTGHAIKDGGRRYASVQISGQEVKRIDLVPGQEKETFHFKTKLGENDLIVEDGKVWVEESNCRDQICVHMAPIYQVGETIICLPHEFLVEVKADKKSPDDLDLLVR